VNKHELLKGLDYMYALPPSKWNLAIITRFKTKLMPHLIYFISGSPDMETATKTNVNTILEKAKTPNNPANNDPYEQALEIFTKDTP
jgi:hypothetical protein